MQLRRIANHRSVLHKLKLQPHAYSRTVIEAAKLRAGEIVLHIARIEVVSHVEEGDARAAAIDLAAKRNLQPLHYQYIESEETGKAAGRVALTYKILLLVYRRKGKTAVPIDHRRHHDVVREREITPEEQAVRHVEWLPAVLVRPDHRVAQIAKISVVVV